MRDYDPDKEAVEILKKTGLLSLGVFLHPDFNHDPSRLCFDSSLPVSDRFYHSDFAGEYDVN